MKSQSIRLARFLVVVVVLFLACAGPVCAQDEPGVAKFRTAKDSQDSLGRAANKASTTLTATLSSSATSATVASTGLFPSSGIILLSGLEVVSYSSKDATHFLGLVRGKDGTAAQGHSISAGVAMVIVSLYHNTLVNAVLGIEDAIGGNGWGASKTPQLTTTQRNALTPLAGWKIWNTTTGREETYDGVGWVAAAASDADLAAIAALSGTGFAVRTGTDTWAQRSIADGVGVTWTNGTGVSGNPSAVWNPTTFVNNVSLWDASQASRTLTGNLSGATDPVLTFSNGQIEQTTGNFLGPLIDKGGAVFNAAGYTDIQAAINAAVAAGKPAIVIPAGTYHITSHLVIGDGMSTTASTIQGFSIIGATGGMALSTGAGDAITGLVNIVADSSMPEMILINGPMGGLRLENIRLDCNALAQTGIRSIHTRRSTYRNIEIREHTGTGFVLTAYTTYTGEGGVGQILENVRIKSTQNSTVGFDFGVPSFTSSDVAQVHGVNLIAQLTGTGTTGVILRGIDSSNFSFLDTRGSTTALRVIPPTGSVSYPDVINIYNAALENTSAVISVTGTWTPPGGGIFVMPFSTIDGETFPAESRLWGLDNTKTWHGAFTFADPLTLKRDAIGITPADTILLTNTTAVAAGVQQISPALHWTGQGWKTNATAGSQSVDFRSYVVPVQGTANPTGYLSLQSSVNGAAYSEVMRLNNTGSAGGGGQVGVNLGAATQVKTFDIHVVESGVVNSVLNLQNDATANGTGAGLLVSALNDISAQKFLGGLSASMVSNDHTAGEQGRLNLRVMKAGSLLTPVTLDATDGFKLGAEFPLTLDQSSGTPANPSSSNQARIYLKGTKLIVQYNDAGTVKYFSMSLTQAVGTATWTVATTAP